MEESGWESAVARVISNFRTRQEATTSHNYRSSKEHLWRQRQRCGMPPAAEGVMMEAVRAGVWEDQLGDEGK